MALRRRVRIEKPSEPQTRFWASKARHRVFLGGRGSGKTYAATIAILLEPPSNWLVVAPTYKVLKDATLYKFRQLCELAQVWDYWHGGDFVAKLSTGHEFTFRSATDPDSLRGPTKGGLWFDESAFCKADSWLTALGTLRGYPAKSIHTTTPNGSQSWLAQARIKENWLTIRASTASNPNLPPSFLGDMKGQYNEFWQRQEIEAEELDDPSEVLVPLPWWEATAKAWDPNRRLVGLIRMASDIAKGNGGDRATILVRDDGGILDWVWSREWDKARVALEMDIRRKMYAIPQERITYDAAGIGEDFAAYCLPYGFRPIEYRGNFSAGLQRAFNLRSAAGYFGLSMRLNPTIPDPNRPAILGIVLQAPFAVRPDWMEEAKKEVTAIRVGLDASGRRKLELKEEFQERLGYSPDLLDVLIQSFAFNN